MSDDVSRAPEPNVRAAYGYLSDMVRKFADHSSVTLLNKLKVAETAMALGPQVTEYAAAGRCYYCGRWPAEDGYFTCEDCNNLGNEDARERALKQHQPAVDTRASVSHITDDMNARVERVADEIYESWRVTANRDAYVVDAIRAAAREGASIGCAVSTGALVSPEQTTDHAGQSVSPVTDGMVDRVEQAWPRIFLDGDTDWRGKLRALAEAALAGRTVAPEPELIELPKFQGCTNSNPYLCACGEAALMCAACDEEIEDNSRAYTMREKCKPWLADDDRDQEWQDVWWHASCDQRSAGSQVGDQHG